MSTLTKEDREWIAEKKIAANQFEKIMGYRMPVRDVPEGKGSSELAQQNVRRKTYGLV